MYTVEFYEDVNGNSTVRDYIEQLVKNSPTDKNTKINKNKIFAYIKALQEYGTRIGKPIVKHIEGKM